MTDKNIGALAQLAADDILFEIGETFRYTKAYKDDPVSIAFTALRKQGYHTEQVDQKVLDFIKTQIIPILKATYGTKVSLNI